MKKKILLLVLLSFFIAGVVSASSSIWGDYKGNQIIRITVDGVPTKVTDVPAMLYNERTMIPIYLLKEAGVEYEWDDKTRTVNIISQKKPEIAEEPDEPEIQDKPTVKDIYNQSVNIVGYVEAMDAYGNVSCSGSGFMVSPGFFITNYHVAMCGNTGKIYVKIAGKIYDNGNEGWYMFANQNADLYGLVLSTSYDSKGMATGEIPQNFFNIVKTELPEVGDKVYVIGSPYGLENTVSEGIVSGIRMKDNIPLIQHTADTEHGSSGGVLLDEYGYVIGVTTYGIDGTNLDFAVPIKYVQDEINNLQ